MGGPTNYELLGVDPDASPAEIKTAFRQQVMRNHPDQGGNAALFRMLEEAYEVLISPSRRAEYDAWLSGEPRTPPHGVEMPDEPPSPDQPFVNRKAAYVYHDQPPNSAWDWAAERTPWKKLILLTLVGWVILALVTGTGVIPGVSGATVAWGAVLFLFCWVFGSWVLRMFGWVAAIVALADAYMNNVPAGITAARLAFAFAVWLCGQWFYTFKKGRWHSVLAHGLLSKLPSLLRPDRRWGGI